LFLDCCVVGTRAAVITNESLTPMSQRWYAPRKYVDAATSGLQGPSTNRPIRSRSS
jgi:hypothetical protein